MLIYVHEGSGHWIGSVVIVTAECLERAKNLIRKELDDMGLEMEEIGEVKILNTSVRQVVYVDSGDY